MAGESILVVDDNATNVKLASFVLRRDGFAVSAVGNGEELMSRLSHTLPRLILMDVQLPVTDGYELTRRLKADPRTRDIPVVAFTSEALKGEEQRALSAGCCGYITKPINTRTFSSLIAGFLDKRS